MGCKLIQGDCLETLRVLNPVTMIFADPPDNIGLKYSKYKDRRPDYVDWLEDVVTTCMSKCDHLWVSFNSKWTFAMGRIFERVLQACPALKAKPCIQRFTFGQHNPRDLGNDHRPLWRLSTPDAPLYPNAIRVESVRQQIGDKRANPKGRVPGDVFDFPRVVGTGRQRRAWHPTQLHEGLVERCVKLCTHEGDHVLDPFGGTGTTLRVCRRLKRPVTLIELDGDYCKRIAEENGLKKTGQKIWGI